MGRPFLDGPSEAAFPPTDIQAPGTGDTSPCRVPTSGGDPAPRKGYLPPIFQRRYGRVVFSAGARHRGSRLCRSRVAGVSHGHRRGHRSGVRRRPSDLACRGISRNGLHGDAAALGDRNRQGARHRGRVARERHLARYRASPEFCRRRHRHGPADPTFVHSSPGADGRRGHRSREPVGRARPVRAQHDKRRGNSQYH